MVKTKARHGPSWMMGALVALIAVTCALVASDNNIVTFNGPNTEGVYDVILPTASTGWVNTIVGTSDANKDYTSNTTTTTVTAYYGMDMVTTTSVTENQATQVAYDANPTTVKEVGDAILPTLTVTVNAINAANMMSEATIVSLYLNTTADAAINTTTASNYIAIIYTHAPLVGAELVTATASWISAYSSG